MEDKLIEAFSGIPDPDARSLGFLCRALQAHNSQGFDYLEFRLALHELGKREITGDLALRSALATASAMGVEKTELIRAIDRYLQVLTKEQKAFDEALESASRRRIEDRKKEIQSMDARIDNAKGEILRLEASIVEMEEHRRTAQEAIQQASAELEQAEQTFRNTVDQVVASMQKDRKDIDAQP